MAFLHEAQTCAPRHVGKVWKTPGYQGVYRSGSWIGGKSQSPVPTAWNTRQNQHPVPKSLVLYPNWSTGMLRGPEKLVCTVLAGVYGGGLRPD